jgi:3-oxoacyl-[acyl-carrier protein] reductase
LSDGRGLTVLVTDGDDDVGRAIALAFAAEGASVAVHSRDDRDRAESVATEARALGVGGAGFSGDLTDPEQVASLVEASTSTLGGIDVLVHAGEVRPHPLVVDTSIDEWHRVIDTNCSSFFYLARLLVPPMAERRFGRLIALNVGAGSRPRPRHGAVQAARDALTSFVQVLATETGRSGITANVVSHAVLETSPAEARSEEVLGGMLAIPRPGRLSEVAAACLYLASDRAAYVTGQVLAVDGGFHI